LGIRSWDMKLCCLSFIPRLIIWYLFFQIPSNFTSYNIKMILILKLRGQININIKIINICHKSIYTCHWFHILIYHIISLMKYDFWNKIQKSPFMASIGASFFEKKIDKTKMRYIWIKVIGVGDSWERVNFTKVK